MSTNHKIVYEHGHAGLTRRYCLVCKQVTTWKIDPAINHSRCLICHSNSSKSRKIKKTTKEEPKLNKQYVKEQIDQAVETIRKEYDAKLATIYQCPDCGAVTIMGTDHVCLQGKIPVSAPEIKPKRKTIFDYVLAVVPCSPPDGELVNENAPHLAKNITANVMSAGYSGSPGSVITRMAELVESNKIMRRTATIKISSSRNGKKYPKDVPGFVYWRAI